MLAGRLIAPAPRPPIAPRVIIRIDTFGLKVESKSPIVAIILPEMQIFRSPNLFVNPPTIGPNMDITPENREPTTATEAWSEQK